MADYKTIHGTKVRTYTTNPDNPIEGQVWYNDTDNVLKFQFPNRTSSWRTANALNTARDLLGATGIQTASLVFGGPSSKTVTESYDGTSWTEVNDLNSGRQSMGAAGTYTAALAFGGYPLQANVETWNGSSWTETTDINTARQDGASAGALNTAALLASGIASGIDLSLKVVENFFGKRISKNTAKYMEYNLFEN